LWNRRGHRDYRVHSIGLRFRVEQRKLRTTAATATLFSLDLLFRGVNNRQFNEFLLVWRGNIPEKTTQAQQH
jgi:hypothetical protein